MRWRRRGGGGFEDGGRQKGGGSAGFSAGSGCGGLVPEITHGGQNAETLWGETE